MTRPLTVFHPVTGDTDALVERFLDDPASWLPGDARPAGPGCWWTTLRFGQVTHPALCHLQDPWRAHGGWWRRMRWEPAVRDREGLPTERLLPVLDGELAMLVDGSGRASLTITANYEVPAAGLGQALDVVLLGRVARRTALTFLAEVAERLDREPVAATGPGAIR